ncbi:MAG: hypothetical protein NTU61_03910, partial [Candidatus Altiarchaeota archaeon]|nr:hypothetical protein [Candidatus Altiarchaeota archaeon]
VLIGFFIGLLLGGSGGYFFSPQAGKTTIIEKEITKFQCSNGSMVDDMKYCPKGDSMICVNQTKYIFRNETVFMPCDCLKDCGVYVAPTTTTTFPQKPKVYCNSNGDCGSTVTGAIKCSVTQEAYRLLITPKCFLNVTQPFCIEEQSKEVVKQCGAETEGEICKPGVGCIIQSDA